MSNLTPAEQKVRKLARIPANAVCPNCGIQKKFGFSTICIKFGTFVCNECKSSHQAISHRCKSLTMSSWDMKEVDELERLGNDHARNTWLKHAPPCGTGGRPRPGSDISVFKLFVLNAYDRRKYYGEASEPGSNVQPPNVAPIQAATPSVKSSRPQAPMPTPVPAPVSDLLDFGASFTAPAAGSGNDDDFGAFQGVSSGPQPLATSAATFDVFSSGGKPPSHDTSNGHSSFDAFASKPVSSVSNSFDAFASSAPAPATGAPSSSTFGDFDALAGSNLSLAPGTLPSAPALFNTNGQEPPKKPIMGSNASNAISSMDFSAKASMMNQPYPPNMRNNVAAMTPPYGMTSVNPTNYFPMGMMGNASMNGSPAMNGAVMNNNMVFHNSQVGTGFAAPTSMMGMNNGMSTPMMGMNNGMSLANGSVMSAWPTTMGVPSNNFSVGGTQFAVPSAARTNTAMNHQQRSWSSGGAGTTDTFADLCQF